MKTSPFLILILVLALLTHTAVTQPLNVTTDKQEYRKGETVTVTITGPPGVSVAAQVYEGADPSKTKVVKQGTLTNGQFTFTFTIGQDWNTGQYTIEISGGGYTASTTFTVTEAEAEQPPTGGQPPPSRQPSSLTLDTPRTARVGEEVEIGGRLTPAINTTITLRIYPPGSPAHVLTLDTVNGNFTHTFTLDRPGTWRIEASWGGNSQYQGSSDAKTITVSRRTCSIAFTPLRRIPRVQQELTIQGHLVPPIPGAQIQINYTRPDGTQITHTATTDSNGRFTDTTTLDQGGDWLITAKWPGNDAYEGCQTTILVTVLKIATLINITATPAAVETGTAVTIQVAVTPPVDADILLQVNYNNTGWTILTTLTGAANYTFTPDKPGTYRFRASWGGDIQHQPATATVTLHVAATPRIINMTTPAGREEQVKIASNSTIRSAEVNIEEGRISVEVEGPSGTAGILAVRLPVALLEAYDTRPQDLVILVNGREVNYTWTLVDGQYVLTLQYSHSRDRIDIYLTTYTTTVTVTDYTGQPVQGATVRLEGPVTRAADTDANGQARLARLPPGNYTLTVKYGPLTIAQTTLKIPTEKTTVQTELNKYRTLYQQLEQENQRLKQENQRLKSQTAQLQTICYILAAATAVLIIALAAALKRRRQA